MGGFGTEPGHPVGRRDPVASSQWPATLTKPLRSSKEASRPPCSRMAWNSTQPRSPSAPDPSIESRTNRVSRPNVAISSAHARRSSWSASGVGAASPPWKGRQQRLYFLPEWQGQGPFGASALTSATIAGMKLVGQDVPWILPGPDGTVSVLGVVFAGDEAILDNGALHARSHLEQGVRFSEDPAAKGRGERVLSVWVTYPGALAERYHGAVTATAWIDRAAKTGWKRPIDHVNRMSDAVRGKVDLSELSAAQRASLAELLRDFAPKAWDAAPEDLRRVLG